MDDYLYKTEFRNIKSSQVLPSTFWVSIKDLELSAVQLFVYLYFNPNRETNRLVLKLGTGIGKTIASLQIARGFIKTFMILYENLGQLRCINIVGFTKSIYKKELLAFPELGIITHEELYKLGKLKEMLRNSNSSNREQIEKEYSNFVINIKKRISNRNTGGLYNFFGYKELFTSLFTKVPDDLNIIIMAN